jgi:hypothetical protein
MNLKGHLLTAHKEHKNRRSLGSDPLQKLQDIRQTKEYASYMEKNGWVVEKINSETLPLCDAETTNIFIKKLPLLPFSVAKVLHYHEPLQLTKVNKICKKYHVLLRKQEPFEIEKIENGYVWFKVLPDNKQPLVPTKTLWLNLVKTEKELLAQMKQKTRYNLKKATNLLFESRRYVGTRTIGDKLLARARRINASVIPGNKVTKKQLSDFYALWRQNKPYDWLFKPSFYELNSLIESFGKKCFFVFIYPCHPELVSGSLQKKSSFIDSGSCIRQLAEPVRNDEKHNLLAACLILTSQNMAFYWHNCSTHDGKKLFAPTLCIWQALKESKKRGLKIFDFEGLWDERFPKLNKGWQGFGRFKEGFRKT